MTDTESTPFREPGLAVDDELRGLPACLGATPPRPLDLMPPCLLKVKRFARIVAWSLGGLVFALLAIPAVAVPDVAFGTRATFIFFALICLGGAQFLPRREVGRANRLFRDGALVLGTVVGSFPMDGKWLTYGYFVRTLIGSKTRYLEVWTKSPHRVTLETKVPVIAHPEATPTAILLIDGDIVASAAVSAKPNSGRSGPWVNGYEQSIDA